MFCCYALFIYFFSGLKSFSIFFDNCLFHLVGIFYYWCLFPFVCFSTVSATLFVVVLMIFHFYLSSLSTLLRWLMILCRYFNQWSVSLRSYFFISGLFKLFKNILAIFVLNIPHITNICLYHYYKCSISYKSYLSSPSKVVQSALFKIVQYNIKLTILFPILLCRAASDK